MVYNRDTVYFVSDAHFGVGEDVDKRVLMFVELAAEMRERAAALYMVGDMFGFWIEYRYAVRPDYFPVLHALRSLVEAGVSVHYLTGNHDFAVGSFLENTVGIAVHRDPVDTVLQGRRLHINHGDRVRNNGAQRIIGRVLGNKFCRAIYKIIHPDIGVKLGMLCTRMLRKRSGSRDSMERVLEMYRQAARAKIKAGECDLVIYAHTHHGEHVKFDDGGEYCNTGAWMNNYNYAVMRDGEIRLLKFASTGTAGRFQTRSGNL